MMKDSDYNTTLAYLNDPEIAQLVARADAGIRSGSTGDMMTQRHIPRSQPVPDGFYRLHLLS